jgi:hypothetical protein
VLSTIGYELGAHAARDAGVAVGTALGLLNLAWAAGATVAPLAAGAALSHVGTGGLYGLLALTCAAAALSLFHQPHRRPGLTAAAAKTS